MVQEILKAKFGQTECAYSLTNSLENKSVVVFLPGVSGGIFDSRFDFLENATKESNVSFFRCEVWKDSKDLTQKTISNLVLTYNDIVNFLLKKGFKKIFLLGKSFGGLLSILVDQKNISGLVLIAPAIFLDKNKNIELLSKKYISEIISISDIKLDESKVSLNKLPSLIIHGSMDNSISIENSQKLVSLFFRGELFVIEGADHSFRNSDHQKLISNKLEDYLNRFAK